MPRQKDACMDCGKPITKGYKRCRSCALKMRWARGDYAPAKKNYCVNCEKQISVLGVRCGSCAVKLVWATHPDREGWAKKGAATLAKSAAEGTNQTEEARRKRSEGLKKAHARGCWDSPECRERMSKGSKAAWERGAHDGIFQSPTRPEQTVMTVLDILGIGYEFNTFRLKRFPFDFRLTDHPVLIEYDGWYWHNLEGRPERDVEKDQLAAEAGYTVVRLKGQKKYDLAGPEIWEQLCEKLEALNVIQR